jgi:hypothetical protein
MALTEAPSAATQIDEEVTIAADELAGSREKFEALVRRLSHQSVVKHYDAYADIPWDEPEFVVDPDDSRWILPELDPLGSTAWYRSQPTAIQSRIGLFRFASAAKLGLEFENVLKRGLLEHAFFHLPDGDPTFRYLYHEVIEECHHGLMFQEFVNRTGMPIPGMPRWMKRGTRHVVRLGRVFPELFFIFVLGGEDPIDHIQRETLRSDRELPPIIETIMRHHVTEEARHLSFARHYLKQEVPKLGFIRRQVLAIGAPIILGIMAALMIQPPRAMAREFAIPNEVLDEAYRGNPDLREATARSVRKVRQLCRELRLINPVSKVLWKRFGIWADDDVA